MREKTTQQRGRWLQESASRVCALAAALSAAACGPAKPPGTPAGQPLTYSFEKAQVSQFLEDGWQRHHPLSADDSLEDALVLRGFLRHDPRDNIVPPRYSLGEPGLARWAESADVERGWTIELDLQIRRIPIPEGPTPENVPPVSAAEEKNCLGVFIADSTTTVSFGIGLDRVTGFKGAIATFTTDRPRTYRFEARGLRRRLLVDGEVRMERDEPIMASPSVSTPRIDLYHEGCPADVVMTGLRIDPAPSAPPPPSRYRSQVQSVPLTMPAMLDELANTLEPVGAARVRAAAPPAGAERCMVFGLMDHALRTVVPTWIAVDPYTEGVAKDLSGLPAVRDEKSAAEVYSRIAPPPPHRPCAPTNGDPRLAAKMRDCFMIMPREDRVGRVSAAVELRNVLEELAQFDRPASDAALSRAFETVLILHSRLQRQHGPTGAAIASSVADRVEEIARDPVAYCGN